MKKIVLSITAVCAAFTMNAQSLVNGGFESVMTPVAAFAYTHSTAGWQALINGGPEAAAFEGTQAAKLVTTSDPALNLALSWGDDIIPGIAQQRYNGPIANPATLEIDFAVRADIVGVDTCFVQVTLVDTMGAGNADDVTLFFDNVIFTSDLANWTPVNFTMIPTGATGTANRMNFIALSTVTGYFDLNTPTPGTTLWIDGITVSNSVVGIDEITSFGVNKAFPNPTTDVLNIVVNSEAKSVSVMSMDGKIVATQSMNGTTASINVADLTVGTYFYEVTSADGAIVRNTFVKK